MLLSRIFEVRSLGIDSGSYDITLSCSAEQTPQDVRPLSAEVSHLPSLIWTVTQCL